MKNKLLIIIVFMLTITFICGCNNNKNLNKKDYSERKNKIINLLKNKMIDEGYISKDNLESFDVLKIYVDGYYKNDLNKKNIEIDFKYTCEDKTNNCIDGLNYNFDNDFMVVWLYTDYDENNIYNISQGISISSSDIDNGNYVRTGEIVK